jgi:hypothetical protein
MTAKPPRPATPQARLLASILLFSVLIGSSVRTEAIGFQREGGQSQTGESKFRLIRSISGSRGHEEGGRFVVDDPRTVFRVSDDRQVLVYVEWECVAGQHEFEGLWKNPAGKVVAVSDFKLDVRGRRCSGYFTFLLSETTEAGIWTLEARVDAEVTGHHSSAP